MSRNKDDIKAGYSAGSILYWTVGTLLILTLLSAWFVSGLFAKYVISAEFSNSARVGKNGTVILELNEHLAKESYPDSGIYELDKSVKPVTKNEYKKVLPGVDIPKDPYVSLELKNTEVNYVLYLYVTKSSPFPEGVTYDLTDEWNFVRSEKGSDIFQYVDENGDPVVFKSGTSISLTGSKVIPILKGNELKVSEHYEGNNKEFSLTFLASLVQDKTN